MNMPVGRPYKYNDSMLKEAQDYLLNYFDKHGHATPSIVGLARVLGVCTKTVQNWDNPEFLRTLEQIKDEQHFRLIDGGLTNKFNSNITKLMLANFGHSDKQQIESTNTHRIKGKKPTREELIAIINETGSS